MRDGVRLSTDLYFPKGAGEKLPVILIRTPYSKKGIRDRSGTGPYFFAGQGYVVAVQDVRGKFESEGKFMAYPLRPGIRTSRPNWWMCIRTARLTTYRRES